MFAGYTVSTKRKGHYLRGGLGGARVGSHEGFSVEAGDKGSEVRVGEALHASPVDRINPVDVSNQKADNTDTQKDTRVGQGAWTRTGGKQCPACVMSSTSTQHTNKTRHLKRDGRGPEQVLQCLYASLHRADLLRSMHERLVVADNLLSKG